jgi:hypothetical protein
LWQTFHFDTRPSGGKQQGLDSSIRPVDERKRELQSRAMESLDSGTPHIPTTINDDPLLSNRDLARRWQCSPSYLEKKPPNELPPRCSVLP